MRNLVILLLVLMAATVRAQNDIELKAGQPLRFESPVRLVLSVPAGKTAVVTIDSESDYTVRIIYTGLRTDFLHHIPLRAPIAERVSIPFQTDGSVTIVIEPDLLATPRFSGTAVLSEIRDRTSADSERQRLIDRLTRDRSAMRELAKDQNRGAVRAKQRALAEAILRNSESASERFWELEALIHLARLELDAARFESAKAFAERAIAISRSIENKWIEADLLNTKGSVLFLMNELVEARETHNAARKLAVELNLPRGIADADRGLGEIDTWEANYVAAIKRLEAALRIYETEKDRLGIAKALNSLGNVYIEFNDKPAALRYFNQSLEVYSELGDKSGMGATLNNIGVVNHNIGDVRTALGFYLKALPLTEAAGDTYQAANGVASIGAAYDRLGEYEKAFEFYNRAISMYRAIGPNNEAYILNNLALMLRFLGDNERALALFEESLKQRRLTSDLPGEANVLVNIGVLLDATGKQQAAIDNFKTALGIYEKLNRKAGIAMTTIQMAASLRKQGRLEESSQLLKKALTLTREVNNRRDEASSLGSLGLLEADENRPESALRYFVEATAIWNSLEDRAMESLLLYRQAKALRSLNRKTEAIERIERSIALVERIRSRIPNQRLRATYYAKIRSYYELYIDLLVERGGEDSEARTLEISERAKARSLLETLEDARIDFRRGADPELLEQERLVVDKLTILSRDLTSALASRKTESIEKLRKDVVTAETELETIRDRLSVRSREYYSMSTAQPASAREIQEALDRDTVVVEFQFVEDRVLAWIVDTNKVTMTDLGNRAAIEAAARLVYESVSVPQRKIDLDEFRTLVIQPLQRATVGKRLAIVADGLLQFIPFAAFFENEIVMLPSASYLTVSRRMARTEKSKTIAIFADPVFDAGDSRIRGASTSPNKTPEVERIKRAFGFGDDLPRLLNSRFEARGIASIADSAETLIRVDFDANRENLESGELRNYRIVHFATHGIFDSERPEFSGFVLSLFDKSGKMRDGYIRLNQIYNLELDSDLVVLSACQTALGTDVKGEGLIGLTRGFMFAGARRVLATLWKIDDAATAEFMKIFYRHLLRDKRSAAAALKLAQSEFRSIPRYRLPYYWAGFALHGDWR